MEESKINEALEKLSLDNEEQQDKLEEIPCKFKKKDTSKINKKMKISEKEKPKPQRISIRQYMATHKKQLSDTQSSFGSKIEIIDVFETAETCRMLVKNETGVIYDDKMTLHACPWDLDYPENPSRYTEILERCRILGLLERCVKLNYTLPNISDITRVHNTELYEKLKNINVEYKTTNALEEFASNFDSVYFNEETFMAATISVGCAISLVEAICNNTVQNGMAIIRPPGHHATNEEYCGYCFFNNVAIAAQYALDNKLAERILIIDFDVHHGQGTQRMFYNTDKVLYFSIHRYEHGTFWPNLRESDYDYIGSGKGLGYNINVPLNAIGLDDSDYMCIIHHILLPVAYEYQPNLIIISAGYDACIGCKEGEMFVTPAFYAHLIVLISGLAKGKIAVCLEGGYFKPSLAEGAAMTLKALLGDSPPSLQPIKEPHFTVTDTINNIKIVLYNLWNCFGICEVVKTNKTNKNLHQAITKYLGKPLAKPFATRNCYPVHSFDESRIFYKLICDLQFEYQRVGNNQTVAFCYDDIMLRHSDNRKNHVENPSRLESTYKQYLEWCLNDRCLNIKPVPLIEDVMKYVHDNSYIDAILSNNFLEVLSYNSTDMYHNNDTALAIQKAVECTIAVVNCVMNETCRSGVALIRPPGHHADVNTASGFCYVNNIAIAAKYLLKRHQLKRILIIDFDVHHGNGTQNIFYEENKVLYISIHKYLQDFYPQTVDGGCDYCGRGEGEGFNVNVALNAIRMHNVDYIAIFNSIVLPIAYSYMPEIVLVSAGFDAGIHDPLGKYSVTPEFFGHFIQLLKPLANGKLILLLEGGYNVTTVKYSMNICIKTLLGDPLPLIKFEPHKVNNSCQKVIRLVKEIQKKYWPVLNVDETLHISKPKEESDINTEYVHLCKNTPVTDLLKENN